MKKKLALLLAAVMTITSIPALSLQVDASSTNRITHPNLGAVNATVVFEQGLSGLLSSGPNRVHQNASSNIGPTSAAAPQNRAVEHWTDGTNLEITLGSAVSPGDQFQLILEGAEWFFRDNTAPRTSRPSTNNDFNLNSNDINPLTGVAYNAGVNAIGGVNYAFATPGGGVAGTNVASYVPEIVGSLNFPLSQAISNPVNHTASFSLADVINEYNELMGNTTNATRMIMSDTASGFGIPATGNAWAQHIITMAGAADAFASATDIVWAHLDPEGDAENDFRAGNIWITDLQGNRQNIPFSQAGFDSVFIDTTASQWTIIQRDVFSVMQQAIRNVIATTATVNTIGSAAPFDATHLGVHGTWFQEQVAANGRAWLDSSPATTADISRGAQVPVGNNLTLEVAAPNVGTPAANLMAGYVASNAWGGHQADGTSAVAPVTNRGLPWNNTGTLLTRSGALNGYPFFTINNQATDDVLNAFRAQMNGNSTAERRAYIDSLLNTNGWGMNGRVTGAALTGAEAGGVITATIAATYGTNANTSPVLTVPMAVTMYAWRAPQAGRTAYTIPMQSEPDGLAIPHSLWGGNWINGGGFTDIGTFSWGGVTGTGGWWPQNDGVPNGTNTPGASGTLQSTFRKVWETDPVSGLIIDSLTRLPITRAGGFLSRVGGNANSATYYRLTPNQLMGGNVADIPNPPNSGPGSNAELAYSLHWSGGNHLNTATVTIIEGGGRGDRLVIPMAIRVNSNGDVRVRIDSTLGAVTSANMLISSQQAGRTNTNAVMGGQTIHQWPIGRIQIAELRTGTIFSAQPWEFELRAPRGYVWRLTQTQGASSTTAPGEWVNTAGVNFITQGGLLWGAAAKLTGTTSLASEAGPADPTSRRTNAVVRPSSASPWGTATAAETTILDAGRIHVRYRQRGNSVDESVIDFYVPANMFQRSTGTVGSLHVQGLTLIPEDFETVDDGRVLQAEIRNIVGNVITNQVFTLGTARDFNITLNRIVDEIPTLISGRLEGQSLMIGNQFTGETRVTDREHQAASVRFQEVLTDSWWAERSTSFTLPEGVRFLKVELFDARDTTPVSSFFNGSVIASGRGQTPLPTNLTPYPWYNAGRRLGDVTINDNTMILTGFSVATGATARFDIHTWLNIQVDFEGPIAMTLGASAFRRVTDNYDVSTVIANAVRPVEIVTEVRDARIGFQFVSVADFEIVENVPGGMLTGEDVYVTVTDLISTDMAFAPGFRAAVTDGNIRISNIRTAGNLGYLGSGAWLSSVGGQMQFTVERGSSVASTISFADVQVRIDRTVPFSNLSNVSTSGYRIHVWGPAIARNFIGLEAPARFAPTPGGTLNPRDYFDIGSISEHYVRIETPGELNHSPFANHVELPIPSATVTINGVETELGAETWIDPVSSSAMVPVRFIAYALGLPEGAVVWDPINSTVTVDAVSSGGRIVQFQTGNSAYLVNGVAVRMVSSNNEPVEMTIRDGRSFVPFRALGEAFGIPVSWDGDRAVAIYNAPTHFAQQAANQN